MFMQSDHDHLSLVRTATEVSLREAIGPVRDVALLDAPALLNVGDTMIWAGQLAYMKRLGLNVRYIADMHSYDPLRLRRSLPDGGAVLLRGGGNFGDIWVGHQNFREDVARDLPDYRIVQLTQSVKFNNPGRAVQANRILGGHPDFHLLVRDELSLERASKGLPDVATSLSYDMALGWEPTRPINAPRDRVLAIAREDREAASGLAAAAPHWQMPHPLQVTDWVSAAARPRQWHATRKMLHTNGKVVLRKRTGKAPWVHVPTSPQALVERQLDYLNSWNLRWATRLFGQSRAIVTDRLHAHVMAALLGIPHVVLDNDHGKVSTVFEAYTGQFAGAFYATSLEEARDLLYRLSDDGDQ